MHGGLDVEVFSSALLEKAYAKAKSPQEREHVTPYMYAQGHGFRIKQLTPNFDYSELRWTVDTIEDFLFVEEIYHALYPTNHNFTMFDVLKLLEKRPELSKINSEISQKNWHS
ncbi:MAG: hypothetical protein EOP04_06065 [Proteobacteria bacterium]|nr:MAG: hypothetical protein EOP04_06065 [Pseudomonadota bacterium]